MTIREATVGDLDALVALGLRFLESPAYADHIVGDPATMRNTAEMLIVTEAGVVFVSEVGGVVTGMLGLHCSTNPLSGRPVVSELMWYTRPESRGTSGLRLFAHGLAWAKAHGATQLQMLQPACEERLGALYERLGFRRVEVAWQLAL